MRDSHNFKTVLLMTVLSAELMMPKSLVLYLCDVKTYKQKTYKEITANAKTCT